MKSIEMTAKTTEEAISAGLEQLGVSLSDVKVDIVEEGSKGLFGLFGSRPAKVRLTVTEEDTADEVHEIFANSLTGQNTAKTAEKAAPAKAEAQPVKKPTAKKPAAPKQKEVKAEEKQPEAEKKPAEKKPAAEKKATEPKAEKPAEPAEAAEEEPAASVEEEIRSATASAWARSIFPFRKARCVNSPGPAIRHPAATSLRISSDTMYKEAWQDISTESSPV